MHFYRPYFLSLFFVFLHVASHNLNAAVHWNDRQEIQDVEERIMLNCRTSGDFALRQNTVQSLVTNVRNHTQQFASPVIAWIEQSPSVILSNMLWIHDRKLRNRSTATHHSSYTTSWERGPALLSGVNADPCPTYFQVEGKRYKLILNYNESNYTEQPGNYYLMQDLPYRAAITFDQAITIDQYNSKEYQLHLLGEILRRKAIDPHRNDLRDEFHRIPAATGIVMATKLIRDGQAPDTLNRFWRKGGAYHLFSSTYAVRRDNFDALMMRYINHYGINANDTSLLMNTLKIHAAEVFEYCDYEDTLRSLFEALPA